MKKYPAQKFNIEMLLSTIHDLQVKEPVPISARNNIIRQMAANSVKVEIYQEKFRINLFNKIRLFPHEKLTKVYYVGGATQSNRGTYMLMEKSREPFITFLPGLRGFVTPRYMPIEKYWRDYSVFKKNFREIRSVRMEFPTMPAESFILNNKPGGRLQLLSLDGNHEISNFDTLRMMNFLASFSKIDFEAILNDLDKHKKDSVLSSAPFAIISLTDTTMNTSTVKIFHRSAYPGEVDINGKPLPYDLDRAFAQVNNGQDFVVIQFLVFDKILRPQSYFIGGGLKHN